MTAVLRLSQMYFEKTPKGLHTFDRSSLWLRSYHNLSVTRSFVAFFDANEPTRDYVRKDEVFKAILAAADRVGATDWVMIGSQAIHGTIPNPSISTVERSDDVDAFPITYDEWMYEPLHSDLGFESKFQKENGFYFEVVRPRMPRLPEGWEHRIKTETIGQVIVHGTQRDVTVSFPEIHDLLAAKLVAMRPRDTRFFRQVYRMGLIDRDQLLERISKTPKRHAEHHDLAERAARYVEAFYEWQTRLQDVKRQRTCTN